MNVTTITTPQITDFMYKFSGSDGREVYIKKGCVETFSPDGTGTLLILTSGKEVKVLQSLDETKKEIERLMESPSFGYQPNVWSPPPWVPPNDTYIGDVQVDEDGTGPAKFSDPSWPNDWDNDWELK